jgi:hypothetical protein
LGLEQTVPPEPRDHVTTHPVPHPVQTAGESETEDAALEIVGSQAGAFQIPVRWLRPLMALVLAVASVKLLSEAVGAG